MNEFPHNMLPTQRTLNPCGAWVRTAPVSDALDTPEALRAWLKETAAEHDGARWLLGYDHDGVLWGHFDEKGRLTTAREAVKRSKGAQAAARFAQLRPKTLQEVNLFGSQVEVRLWRSDAGRWQARHITEPAAGGDGRPDYTYCFDEKHLLLGAYGEPLEEGFTLVWEGRNRRHQHAVPATLRLHEKNHLAGFSRPDALRLRVRTYVTEGPWHTPALQRHVALVDPSGRSLAAPNRMAEAETSAHF